jgi:hypothetical protein
MEQLPPFEFEQKWLSLVYPNGPKPLCYGVYQDLIGLDFDRAEGYCLPENDVHQAAKPEI